MTCQDCKLYDLDAIKDKLGIVHKYKRAACSWKSKETYPLSVRRPEDSRPTIHSMAPDDGVRCPCFQKR